MISAERRAYYTDGHWAPLWRWILPSVDRMPARCAEMSEWVWSDWQLNEQEHCQRNNDVMISQWQQITWKWCLVYFNSVMFRCSRLLKERRLDWFRQCHCYDMTWERRWVAAISRRLFKLRLVNIFASPLLQVKFKTASLYGDEISVNCSAILKLYVLFSIFISIGHIQTHTHLVFHLSLCSKLCV